MRFTEYPVRRVDPDFSEARLQRAARAAERERQSWGLFAAVVEPEDPLARLQRLDARLAEMTRRQRNLEARCWRDGRRALYRLTADERRRLIDEWNRSWVPATGVYFCDWLRGKGIDPDACDPCQGGGQG